MGVLISRPSTRDLQKVPKLIQKMPLQLLRVLLLICSTAEALRGGMVVRPRAMRMLALRMNDDFQFGEVEISTETSEAIAAEGEELTEKQKEIARLRAAEKFMKRDTGSATCRTCGYYFDYEKGDGYIPRKTPFELLPDAWVCPNCKSPKAFFDPEQIEVAGFEENQAYGIGANTWTEEQKSVAIFGGLGLFFALFMGGYALN